MSCQQLVVGIITGEILKRPTRADCKSADYVFAGSNPALPTQIFKRAQNIFLGTFLKIFVQKRLKTELATTR